MRTAAQFNPFDINVRAGSAQGISLIALQSDDRKWLLAARIECIHAVKVDYSFADLLLKIVAIDLKLGFNDEAQHFYNLFKQVNPRSPFIKYIQQHGQN